LGCFCFVGVGGGLVRVRVCVCVCQPMAGLNSTSLIPARTCVCVCVRVCVCVCVCVWVGVCGCVCVNRRRTPHNNRRHGAPARAVHPHGSSVRPSVRPLALRRSWCVHAARVERRSRTPLCEVNNNRRHGAPARAVHPHGPSVRPSVRSHCGGVGVSTPPGGGVERRSFCGSEQVNDENYKLEIRGSSRDRGLQTHARTDGHRRPV